MLRDINADGVKTGFIAVGLSVSAIFYDPCYVKNSLTMLRLVTRTRDVDHAVNIFYYPYVSEMPWKAPSMWALRALFECLPICKVVASTRREFDDETNAGCACELGHGREEYEGGHWVVV